MIADPQPPPLTCHHSPLIPRHCPIIPFSLPSLYSSPLHPHHSPVAPFPYPSPLTPHSSPLPSSSNLVLEGQLDATLQLRQLLDVLELFSAKWYDLGLRLGMKSYILDNIRKDERDLVKESCRAMFQKWLTKGRGTGDAKRTWRTVLKEVEFIYNAEFRQEVERELQKQVCYT